ncbi:DUF550 domain-containing protein [Klebsiella pneumoniae]|nr:dATP/dGTP pyrophosphohydrolase domain-containing protein [Klebsiella pneumoniae]MDP1242343.1 DUF550 domain-containing protein [Klebsiella pneumoniae]USI18194.1 DUF550 domain-containing protein [Klebsiella pneumoniae]
MSILTKEGIQKILNDDWLLMDDCEGLENCTVIKELARMALAAMAGEPVAWTDEEELRDVNVAGIGYLFGIDREANKFADPRRQIMLYRHAQPAPERDQVRIAHAEWSQATFGNVGPVGPLKHLSKEALEAAAEPGDLSEWADMQFLLWDAQRRAGITDEQITQAMIEKLAVNKQREWPEPKDGEPRLHIKAQPAPVVDADDNFYSWFGREWQENYQHNQYTTAAKQMLGVMAESAWKAGRRAAMLQAEPVTTANKLGNSPVIPDTWIPVSEQMPPSRHEVLVGRWWGEKARWCCKWATYIPGHPDAQSSGWLIPGASWTPTHWMPLPAGPQG